MFVLPWGCVWVAYLSTNSGQETSVDTERWRDLSVLTMLDDWEVIAMNFERKTTLVREFNVLSGVSCLLGGLSN
jgi:phage gp37-like protein